MLVLSHANVICGVGINLFIYAEHLSYRGCGVRYYAGNKDVYAMNLLSKNLQFNKV